MMNKKKEQGLGTGKVVSLLILGILTAWYVLPLLGVPNLIELIELLT